MMGNLNQQPSVAAADVVAHWHFDTEADRYIVYGYDHTTQTSKTTWTNATQTTKVAQATYHYDARGRMVTVEIDSNGDSTIDSTVTYEYDENAQRVSETTDDGSTQTTRSYLFDPQNLTGYAKQLEEYVDTGSGAALDRTFLIGHMILAQHDATNGMLSFIQDGHGSTRALADAVGAIVQRFIFDAFGETLSVTGYTSADNTLTPWLRPDGAYSAATGLTNHIARWRNGQVFMTLDPFAGNAHDPVSLHKYMYAHSNPVMETDPSGAFALAIEFLGSFSTREYLRASDAQRVSIGARSARVNINYIRGASYRQFTNLRYTQNFHQFRSFTARNARHNLIILTGRNPGQAAHAHHVFPQARQLRIYFQRAGINVHNPRYLQWWNRPSHLTNARQYNQLWTNYFRNNPNASRQQILNRGTQFMRQYGLSVLFP